MRLNRFVLFVLFSVFATTVFAQNVSMPDYLAWNKTADHSEPYLYKGNEIQLRDVHFEYYNQERTERSIVTVFHNPDTGKPWIALYAHWYKDEQKPLEAYLFEVDSDSRWALVRDVSKLDNLRDLFKTRYDLVYIDK